jgi:alanine racemase
VLSWLTELAAVRKLLPGESTGYGRGFVATEETWLGILPVGYADGFRRDLSGTHVLVDGERSEVVGAVSMDATAVRLDRERRIGTPVTLVGPGLPLEEHAQAAGTITYELATRIEASPTRAKRVVTGAS